MGLKNNCQLLFGVIACMLFGCSNEMFLTKNEIFNFKIIETKNDGNTYLLLSGLCGHSFWGIKNIEEKEEGKNLQLIITLKPRGDGSFQYHLNIPKHIERVYLGDDVIWQRSPIKI